MRLLSNVPEFCVVPLHFKLIAFNASDISYFINQKAAKMDKNLSHEILTQDELKGTGVPTSLEMIKSWNGF